MGFSIGGALVGGITGFLSGGPAGAVVGATAGGLSGGRPGSPILNLPPPPGGPTAFSLVAQDPCQPGGVCRGPVTTNFYGQYECQSGCEPVRQASGTMGGGGVAVQGSAPAGGACSCKNGGSSSGCQLPNGRKGRTNKTGYFLKDGSYVAPNTRCVTPRRTNYGNDRAAMRASRRLIGARNHYDKILTAIDRCARKSAPRRRKAKCS